MKQKIGVYICHCGGNISDYVDVKRVAEEMAKIEGVEISVDTMFACSDSGQKMIVDDIKNKGLDAIVVASCSPKLHYATFCAVAERGGLNKYNYAHANIREQCSWPHSDNKEKATEKAIRLVRAAIKRVSHSRSLDPIQVDSRKAVAVLGAGVAGMRAALELADLGIKVFLIEKKPFVGGHVARLDKLYPVDLNGKDLVQQLYQKVRTHQNILLFTNAEMIEKSGSIGNFSIKVKITPRYIKDDFDIKGLEKAVDICPEQTDNEFNYNISKRKAIYIPSPDQLPSKPFIDMQICTRCDKCLEFCKAIDFSQQEQILEFKVGGILVATGFDPYQPQKGEFGWGLPGVITLPQLRQFLQNSNGALKINGRKIKSIAYIYCVGSRQFDGPNQYCSRYCCTATLHTAILVKQKYPYIQNFHFTRGVRSYGKYEVIYEQASRQGDIFLQTADDDFPQIEQQKNSLVVKCRDILTHGREIEVPVDLVVLVTGMVPAAHDTAGQVLKLPHGRDHFYNEIHMKLRPVETVIDGVTIAGTCQSPKDMTESINSALSAAAKVYSIVSKDKLYLEPIVAVIDPEKCVWCGKCQEACPFGAIVKTTEQGKEIAQVHTAVCKGCGMCLPVCEPNAIQLQGYTDQEIESMIDALVLQQT